MKLVNDLPLLTKRLHLRRPQRDDAGAMIAYRSLPDVARYQSWDTFGVEDADQLIADQLSASPQAPGSWLQLMIILAKSGQLIGDCGIHFKADTEQQVELGITLDPRYQHHGFACEAIEGVLSYVFGRFNIYRVSATTDADNNAAQRLFRRLRFRQEGHFVEHTFIKGVWSSEYVFAMLRKEWFAHQISDVGSPAS